MNRVYQELTPCASKTASGEEKEVRREEAGGNKGIKEVTMEV